MSPFVMPLCCYCGLLTYDYKDNDDDDNDYNNEHTTLTHYQQHTTLTHYQQHIHQ